MTTKRIKLPEEVVVFLMGNFSANAIGHIREADKDVPFVIAEDGDGNLVKIIIERF